MLTNIRLTSDSVNEHQKQTLALEKAQDEIELLREQVNFLQEYLSEQLQQQQAVEQELHHVNYSKNNSESI